MVDEQRGKRGWMAIPVIGGVLALILMTRPGEGVEKKGAGIGIYILDSAGNQVPHNSPAALAPGDYFLGAIIRNRSVIDSTQIEATLEMVFSVYSYGPPVVYLPPFPANVTHSFFAGEEWPMMPLIQFTVPEGMGGQTGTAEGNVYIDRSDPASLLASATEPINFTEIMYAAEIDLTVTA